MMASSESEAEALDRAVRHHEATAKAPIRRQPGVNAMIEELLVELDRQNSLIGQLEGSLSGVLVPAGPTTVDRDGPAEPEYVSSLTQTLWNIRRQLEDRNSVLADLIERVNL